MTEDGFLPKTCRNDGRGRIIDPGVGVRLLGWDAQLG